MICRKNNAALESGWFVESACQMYRWFVISIISGLLLLTVAGCGIHSAAGKTGAAAGVILVNGLESQGASGKTVGAGPADQPGDAETAFPRPFSDQQLQTALSGLESFGLFAARFRSQADQPTLDSMKEAAHDYMKRYIEPIVKRRHLLKDDTYSRLILSICFQEAYLYFVMGEPAAAREMAAYLQQNLPERLQGGTVQYSSQGEVPIREALRSLEQLIEQRLEATAG